MPTTIRFALGDTVPAFSLPDTDGDAHRAPLEAVCCDTVLIVTCLHCPYVIAWNPRLRAGRAFDHSRVAPACRRRGVRLRTRARSRHPLERRAELSGREARPY